MRMVYFDIREHEVAYELAYDLRDGMALGWFGWVSFSFWLVFLFSKNLLNLWGLTPNV